MRTVLVTGATDGLGRALAHRLAAEGARLIRHGRDEARLQAVARDIGADAAAAPVTVLADLSRLAEVRTLADDVAAATDRLDVLVSNAGIGAATPECARTGRASRKPAGRAASAAHTLRR